MSATRRKKQAKLLRLPGASHPVEDIKTASPDSSYLRRGVDINVGCAAPLGRDEGCAAPSEAKAGCAALLGLPCCNRRAISRGAQGTVAAKISSHRSSPIYEPKLRPCERDNATFRFDLFLLSTRQENTARQASNAGLRTETSQSDGAVCCQTRDIK